jgi:hypothetical protein
VVGWGGAWASECCQGLGERLRGASGRYQAWDREDLGSVVQATVGVGGGSCSREPGASQHHAVRPMGALHWPGGSDPS